MPGLCVPSLRVATIPLGEYRHCWSGRQIVSPLQRFASSARWLATSSAYRSTMARDFHPLSRMRSPSEPPDFKLVESIVARVLNTLTAASDGMLFPSFVMAVSG